MRLSPRFNKIAAVLAALVVVTVGYFLLTTQAAVTYGSLESEDGVLASGATVASDTNASGGKYVLLTKSSGSSGSTSCTINSVYVNSCRPWLSAAAGGYPQVSGGSGSLSQMQFFNKRLNNPNVLSNASAATTLTYKMDVPHIYHSNGTNLLSGAGKDIIADKSLVNDVNAPILINYKPGDKWADTAAGKYDSSIITSANAIKAIAPKKVILSLWHEMENTELSATGLTITGSCKKPAGNVGSAADYRAMYRHVHDVFKAQGVTNVAWGMNYMGYSGWDCAVKDLWPGNDVIDWVLWDPYNGATMTAGLERFYSFLEKNTDATHNFTSKPWGIAEFGNHEVGNAAASWWNTGVSMMGTNWDNTKFPRLKLYSVFDTSTNGGEGGLLRIGYDKDTTTNIPEQTAYDNFAKAVLKFNGGGTTSTTTKATDTVTVSVPSSGTYKVWSRIQAPNTTDNSYDLQIDGGTATTVSTNTTGSWVWVAGPASLSLTSGNHTATLTANGNNVKVDRVMLLADTNCTPTGTGTNCQSSADTATPTVALTSPSNGSTISGTTTISATATDDVGVKSVEFYVDNKSVGTDTTSPYTYSLNTTDLSAGSHSLAVKASDAAGNVGSSGTITVTVSNSTGGGGGGTTGSDCTISNIYVNSCRPWLSAAVGGYSQVSGGSGSLAQFQFFNKRLNNPNVLSNASAATTLTYKLDSPHVYHTPGKVMLTSDAKAIAADSSLVGDKDAPMLINYKPGSNWANTAAGKDDADLIASAKAIKAIAPKHVILSLWHEPENGQISAAGVTITGSCKTPNGNVGSAADYRAMYRHVHDLFKAQGVTNVAWGINYMGYAAWDCLVKDMWPGNDIIDWVLWDPYGSDNTSFQATVARFYGVLEKNTDSTHAFTSKAWGIAETSTHSLGSNAAKWWNDGVSSIGTNWDNNKFPRIKLYSVFDNPNGNSQNRIGYDVDTTLNVAEQTAFNNWAKNLLKFNGGGSTPTADTQAPTTPTGLKSTAQTATSVNLSWTASTDNTGVSGYRLYRDGNQIADIKTTTYTDTSLKAGTSYSYRVAAYDAAGNVSVQSSSLSVSTAAAPDTTAPTAPTGLTADNVATNSVSLSWKASTDNVGVNKYIVQRNQATIAEITTTSYTDTKVSAGTNYSYTVLAADAAGNVSGASNTASVTTPKAADTTPPSKPTNVSTVAVSPTQINVSWTASTDNVGVAGYNVLRDGKVIGKVSSDQSGSTTQFGDATVSANTSYSYTVVALDAAGNVSQASAASQITTPSAGTLTGKKGVWAQYYANKDLGGTPVASQQEALINYDWGTKAPITTVPADNFSAAWTGRIVAPKTGTYTLYTQADDGVRLYIDNTLVIDDWTTHSKKENSTTVSFDAGSKYNFRLEYFEKTGSATVSLLWSGPGLSKQVIPTDSLQPQQYGLTGTYYSDPNLNSVSFTRVDQTVNFNWAASSPSKQLLSDNFSVRWTGQIYIPTTDTYTFYSTSDDGVRLLIDNQQVFKNWNDHAAKEVSGSVTLTGGQKHNITLEYYEAKGDASVNLKWSSPNIKKQVIDRESLRDRW